MKFPIIEIGSFLSGIYVGYSESKGMSVENLKSNILLYGPPVGSMALSYGLNNLAAKLSSFGYKKLKSGGFVTDIDDKESLSRSKKDLEKKLKKASETKLFEPSVLTGVLSGAATFTGYSVGRILGEL